MRRDGKVTKGGVDKAQGQCISNEADKKGEDPAKEKGKERKDKGTDDKPEVMDARAKWIPARPEDSAKDSGHKAQYIRPDGSVMKLTDQQAKIMEETLQAGKE